jgi:malate dehydrogenase (oxaloacetate-decarboxylating)(NADP+)
LGNKDRIRALVEEHEIDLDWSGVEIVDPRTDEMREEYAEIFCQRRNRKGVDRGLARARMRRTDYFGMMMVAEGRAEGVVSGLNHSYPDTVRPALQVIGMGPNCRRIAGMYMMLHKGGLKFFGDTTVNLEQDAESLADVAEMIADAARRFEVEPRVAMLSYSNFGSSRDKRARMIAEATAILRERRPDIEVEGEMQANLAVDYELQRRIFPATRLTGPANVLIFPNLEAGNIAYKLMRELGNVETVGPVLLGMNRPVTALERDCTVDNIVLMTALTVVTAQLREASAQALLEPEPEGD